MEKKLSHLERHPVYKGVHIIDAGSEGKAVGKVDGQVVFIPYAMPGDVVDIQIIKKKKNYLEGKIIDFQSRPDNVQKPFCKHFGFCGGCKWQHMPYDLQLHYKHKQVLDNLSRIGKVNPDVIRPIIGSADVMYYRNKLEFTFSSRKWLMDPPVQGVRLENTDGLGFHLPGMFDRIIDLDECFLQADPSNEMRLAIRDHCMQRKLPFWDARGKKGFMRNLILRNNSKGEWMAILVFSENKQDDIKNVLDFIIQRFPHIHSLMYVINNKVNDDISDLTAHHYHGEDHLTEHLDGLTFRIGPKSFFQTNTQQAGTLYQVVKEFADLKGQETVYDLYSGTGTIALYLARFAKMVLGVESVEEAVKDAQINAQINNISNAHFLKGDMAKVFSQDLMDQYGVPDLVVLDPPRAGLAPQVLERLLDLRVPRIVYVSCNPATQARDLSFLCDIYALKCIQPVDMFPQTHHVENVALLVQE